MHSLVLEGDINSGMVQDIEDELIVAAKGNKIFKLTLGNSRGGDIDAAMSIGRLLRSYDSMVTLRGECNSSCAIIYMSGSMRGAIGGSIGLHRPYFVTPIGSSQLTAEDVSTMYDDVEQYFEEMNISNRVFEEMITTPPEEMRDIPATEVKYWIPDLDPVFSEIEVSNESRRYNISGAEFRQISSLDFSSYCTDHQSLMAHSECTMFAKEAALRGFDPSISAIVTAITKKAWDICDLSEAERNSYHSKKLDLALKSIREKDPSYHRTAYALPERTKFDNCVVGIIEDARQALEQ